MKIKKKPAFLVISLLLLTSMFTTPVFASENKETNDDTLVEKKVPESVTGEKIDGNATVVDYTFSGEKEFYTIVSSDDSVYYLVIDNEKDDSNVYFLRNISDEDFNIKNNIPPQELNPQTPPIDLVGDGTIKEETPTETKSNSSLFMMIIGLVAFGGGAYYFKIVKPKKAKKNEVPDDELEDFNIDENEFEEEIETMEELNKQDDDMSL